MYYTNELLGWIKSIEHLGTDCIRRNTIKKFFDNVVGDICLKKRCSNVTETLAHIGFSELSSTTELVDGGSQRIGEIVKHDNEYSCEDR
jgi:hypothetical protein